MKDRSPENPPEPPNVPDSANKQPIVEVDDQPARDNPEHPPCCPPDDDGAEGEPAVLADLAKPRQHHRRFSIRFPVATIAGFFMPAIVRPCFAGSAVPT